jgi:hypothetical protein
MYRRGNKFLEFGVFGGYDRTTKKWVCAVTIGDRTKPTLTAKIAEMICPEYVLCLMFLVSFHARVNVSFAA